MALYWCGRFYIYGKLLRVPSFFTEPSYFGLFLLPAIYFSILRFNDSYREMTYFNCSIFITAAIFTFSTLTYVGILISAIFAIASKITGIRFAPRNFFLAGIISFWLFSSYQYTCYKFSYFRNSPSNCR